MMGVNTGAGKSSSTVSSEAHTGMDEGESIMQRELAKSSTERLSPGAVTLLQKMGMEKCSPTTGLHKLQRAV